MKVLASYHLSVLFPLKVKTVSEDRQVFVDVKVKLKDNDHKIFLKVQPW